jgi:hypothetical protein
VGLKLNGTHQLLACADDVDRYHKVLAYADDVNLLESNIDTIKKAETLINPSK